MDGSANVTLPTGKIGEFRLPAVNASLPGKTGVKIPLQLPLGRKLLAEWWQVPSTPFSVSFSLVGHARHAIIVGCLLRRL